MYKAIEKRYRLLPQKQFGISVVFENQVTIFQT